MYIEYPDYRVEIKDNLKKFNLSDINPASVTSLNGMYRADPREFEDVIRTFREKGVSEEILEIICKNEEKNPAITTARR